jgi:hypothetical protein
MLDVVVPGVDTPPAAQLCLACRISLACVTAKVAILPIPRLLAPSVSTSCHCTAHVVPRPTWCRDSRELFGKMFSPPRNN